MKKITIIIPVYNEKAFIADVIKRVESVDFGIEKEIILVDDCSTDGTKELYKKFSHKVFYHSVNIGKGASIRTGLENATGDIIVIQDADLEYNPEDYKPLVKMVSEDKADVVYGSRFLNGKNNKNFLFLSFIANKVLTYMTQILYKTSLTDMETCYKVFRADIIKGIKINSNRFDFEPEITAKILKQKVRFLELPITYDARDGKAGKKISWKDGVQAIYTLLKYRFFD